MTNPIDVITAELRVSRSTVNKELTAKPTERYTELSVYSGIINISETKFVTIAI